jgi:hypothetical protein
LDEKNRKIVDLNDILDIYRIHFKGTWNDYEVSIPCTKNVASSVVHSYYCGPPHQFIHNLSIRIQVTRLRNMARPPAITGRYIMSRKDFGGNYFPDDVERDGPRNAGLLATQTPDASASPRTCC